MIITINIGGPQGCVMSAFLFIIYTNVLSLNSKPCKVIKCADDTIVIGGGGGGGGVSEVVV